MAASFLLDEHISPMVAKGLVEGGVDAVAVAGGELQGSADAVVFRSAIDSGRLVVTYNCADFAVLLSDAVRAGVDLPGVVFVDHRTIPTNDIGGLVRALRTLASRIDSGAVNAAMGVWLTRG